MECNVCGAIVVQGGVQAGEKGYCCRTCAIEEAKKRLPHADKEEAQQIRALLKKFKERF